LKLFLDQSQHKTFWALTQQVFTLGKLLYKALKQLEVPPDLLGVKEGWQGATFKQHCKTISYQLIVTRFSPAT
jgi:hypothetical protein